MSKSEFDILLVEDEKNLGAVLKNYLELSGFSVQWVEDGNKGWSAFKSGSFKLCLLDVMMPFKDGFTLGQEIRALNPKVPIIYLTARNQKIDVVKGYNLGADDYITKPFDSEILILKIKALLNRKESLVEEVELHKIGSIDFNVKYRTLSINGELVKLSPKESELLNLLCLHKNDLMPRELALQKIWKEESYFTTRSMDVYITKLRKHLKADPSLSIENYHSNGYMLKSV